MEQYSEFSLKANILKIQKIKGEGLWSSILSSLSGQERTVEQYSELSLRTGEDCGAVF